MELDEDAHIGELQHVPTTKSISAREFLRDLRAGMTDEELAAKYQLTPAKLVIVFNKLLEANALSTAELEDRRLGRERGPYPEMPSDFRISVRERLDFPLAIYEKDFPETRGVVRDISEKGIGARGIESKVGDTKTLVIPAHELFHVNLLEVEAVCRWTTTEGLSGESVGGFEIIRVIQGDMEELQMLIRSLPLEDRVAMRKKL